MVTEATTLRKAVRLLEREGQPCQVKPIKHGYELHVGDQVLRFDRWGQRATESE